MSRLVRIASPGEIPVGQGKTVEIDGLLLAVFNAGSGLYHAIDGSCPHEGGPLADGALLGDSVVCPW
ncbi:MAG TPA: Rieske 2Fe-2S domain-containing protein, partial [Methylomirabilota bacterium]|nr:Rieske 2Fe-2S domain-containing protein [Methylomirabilota bacterium]